MRRQRLHMGSANHSLIMQTPTLLIHPDQYLRMAAVAGVPVEHVIRVSIAARLIRDNVPDEEAIAFVDRSYRLIGDAETLVEGR